MKHTLTPSRLRRSSPLPLAGEGGARRVSGGRVRALSLKKVAKGAGAVVLALVVLDLLGLVVTAYVGAELIEKAKAEGLSGVLRR